MSKNILLVSVDTIKQRTALHFNVDEKLVFPEIKTAQDLYLEPALGTPLFNRLCDGIAAGNLTADETELLNNYVTDALCYYVLMCLPVPITAQFYNNGLLRKTDANTTQLSMSEINDAMNHYKQRADHYKQRLINFLVVNSTRYPLYLDRFGWGDAMPEGSGFNCDFYLGEGGRDYHAVNLRRRFDCDAQEIL